MKPVHDYTDCEVFKPGETWQSPRGSLYRVQSTKIGGFATLVTLKPKHSGSTRSGRLRYFPWDGVMGWVRLELEN